MPDRDVEALARLLETGPTPSGDGPAEVRALASFAQALSAATPQPDQAFKGELRALLLEQARAQQAQALPRILPRVRAASATLAERWRYSTRMAAASLAAALTFSGGGAVAVAAERALPSDPLYSVKLVLDEARAAVRFDSVTKGDIHLANADERIDEAEQSVALGDQPGAARALDESAESARKGAQELIRGYEERGDAAIVARLSDFADTQGDRVRLLAERLTGEARASAEGSLVVLERIEARLVAIGGACGECPAEAPQSGDAFDFSEIPPADEPFQPCPCDEDSRDSAGTRPRGRGGAGDDDGDDVAAPPPSDPSEQPEDPDEPDPVPGVPDPAGDTVNQVIKDITKTLEKGPGGMPPAPEAPAPTVSATPSSSATATPEVTAGVPSGGLGLPMEAPSGWSLPQL